ncbi:hypothetical protein TRFO_03941 [Tritrichomonas foetus]|uniref:THH1/TOM1/TOM3 domain-containing protein n=1 Tax=Tritrichomonas foetus TaxID=1144522 RepID=A0A1J4KK70_9EUKA|nr:hypothetical protein TRFO_03941 [Tritrichomonas foetus]|eukprot:OHT11695.1 hypothetical protein TRFO_03941 [Tritrichomonas foetus]
MEEQKMDKTSFSGLVGHTAVQLNWTEMIVLGSFYYSLALLCFLFLAYDIVNRLKPQINSPNINILFWVSMIIWLIYHGTIRVIPMNYYSQQIYYLTNFALDSFLFVAPISFVMITVLEMLFQYHYPGRFKKVIIRILYVIFVIIYGTLGVFITFVEVDEVGQKYDIMYLWNTCTSILLLVFIVIPAIELLRAVSYPVVQPEDVKCVKLSKLGLVLFFLIYLGEAIYNITVFWGINVCRNWIVDQLKKQGVSSPNVRAFHFGYDLIFDFVPSLIAIFSIYQIRKHDLQFADDPFYAPDQSESSTSHI